MNTFKFGAYQLCDGCEEDRFDYLLIIQDNSTAKIPSILLNPEYFIKGQIKKNDHSDTSDSRNIRGAYFKKYQP